MRRILDDPREELLAEERRLLAELAAALARFEAAPEDQRTLARSAQQLDELFLLVVAGEFNAGKSAFINALLGLPLLEEGVTPTTTSIQLLRYGETQGRAATSTPATSAADANLDVITAPVELLRDIHIVDTPGTNAIHREHEAITREFVPRSDLVLFITSADRPFTESERAFLQGIRDWGKKVVVVVNKIDILESAADVERIRSFIAEHALSLLGAAPDIFPLSARQALRAKLGTDTGPETRTGQQEQGAASELLAASRFAELERFIAATLDESERLRLKLLNPLGIALLLAERYGAEAAARLDLLKDDLTAIDDIDRQLAVYREDMAREFRFRLEGVAGVLQEFEGRGMAFFDDTMRLARILDLLNKTRLKSDFETKVIAGLPAVIARRVQEVIDWLVASDLRQWQAVMEHIAERRRRHADRIVGQVGGTFESDRERLLDHAGRAAQETVDRYDQEHEAARMAESVQAAVASTALVEVGAVGLGALVSHLLAGAAADATGVLAASAVAVLGLFIIPSRREAAKRGLRGKIAALRAELMSVLTAQFDREIERSLGRIGGAVAPYTRFVRAERGRLGAVAEELALHGGQLAGLRRRVSSL